MSTGVEAIEEYKRAKAAMEELEVRVPGIGQLVEELCAPIGAAHLTDGTPVSVNLLSAGNAYVAAARRRARALEVLNPSEVEPPCDTEPDGVA